MMIGAAITTHFPVMGIERWYVMFYDVSCRSLFRRLLHEL